MHRELERVVERFLPVLQWLSASQCQQQLPRRVESWSVQQNVVHLVLTYRSTAQLLERCLAQGPPPSDRPALGQIAPRLLVIGLGIFPRGAKSPERVHPDRLTLPAKSGADLILLLREELARMDTLLAECEAKLGASALGSHFAFGPLTARQWRRFHTLHGYLHLHQVKSLLRAIPLN
ncbi:MULTISPECIES: DinB family protein [Acidobacterium]|uniref:DinB family protein n=1 Tax=Acidobacterium TaxID=33973 RepID=UPI00059F9A49|nr:MULTISPECIES: DinB family protein [Acidobacterium]HCT61541.1 DUF1569 domain-containing protein [Acidobacterium sp.]